MSDFEITATSRADLGKGASRRLRRLTGQVPAVVYGGKSEPQSISLMHKDIMHSLENEAFYSHIIKLTVDGKSQDVILKDVQRHPAKPVLLHLDFQRVSKDQKLTTRVPLHFLNEETCKGVKVQGGQIAHNMIDLEISCLPADLPEYIEVDMTNLEMDQTLHISDLTLPKGVKSIALMHGEDHDQPVCSIHKPKAAVIEDDVAAEAEPEEDGDED